MSSHVEASGRSSAALHYRRMGWLILFGLLHGFLLWYGDILYDYGMCGLLIYLFRRRQPRTLLILGCLTLTVAPLLMAGYGAQLKQMPPSQLQAEREQMWQPTPAQVAEEKRQLLPWKLAGADEVSRSRNRAHEDVVLRGVFLLARSGTDAHRSRSLKAWLLQLQEAFVDIRHSGRLRHAHRPADYLLRVSLREVAAHWSVPFCVHRRSAI